MEPAAAAAHRPQSLRTRGVWAAAAVAGVGALLVAVGVIPLPNFDRTLEDASETLGAWAYPAVASFAFLETAAFVGLLAPGETAVVVGGVVAERGGVELVPLIGLVWLAAAAGDLISFLLGRRLGRPFLDRHGHRLGLGPERMARVDRFYDRHGGKAVLLGRFTGLIRAVSPFVAGASGLALRRFVLWSLAGALLWASAFTMVGYGFSESFAESGETAARIAAGAALAAGIAFLVAARIHAGRRRAEALDTVERSYPAELRTRGPLLVAVNGRASGVDDPHRTARELAAVLGELGADADAVVTADEEALWAVLRRAAALDRRVVLVGGDGTVHAAANAPLQRLPEIALLPSGRANNVARALGIPTSRSGALAVAAGMPAHPLDALRVTTPDRQVFAVEAVSAGFQAEARADYRADNSADLRQGLRALLRAVRRYRPYSARVDVDGAPLRSDRAAQLFLSNLPYFGFGFEVDPGADPGDGRFEAILFEARSRHRLVRLLAAARRGRHLGRRGVRRVSAGLARLTEPLPLVADALPLGTTTATVSVEPARLRVASPGPVAT
jgi:membrane-associated protein